MSVSRNCNYQIIVGVPPTLQCASRDAVSYLIQADGVECLTVNLQGSHPFLVLRSSLFGIAIRMENQLT